MTDSAETQPKTPPAPVLVTAVLIVAVVAWFLLRAYTSPAARECLALYRAAKTAVDTAAIDTSFAAAGRRVADPKTCGSLRSGSRWR